jgi:serine/threonine protein kinase/formylglycine-generating enzyme required for sulfatase activity
MPTQADIRFAQAAVRAGYLSKEKAQELLQAQKQAEDLTGTKADFRQVALNAEALSPDQVKALEEALGLDAQPKVKQFGPYLIQKKLGQGGMGSVYLATDTRSNAPVAIKVLTGPAATDSEYLVRFQREAALAASLKHPSIVACFGTSQEGKIHYMALEYVDGGDLMHLIREAPLPEPQALALAAQLADALVAVHAAGIVHRDIKPHNILLTKDGTPKLADLGLARAELDHSITQSGMVLGTPHYMSPEQAEGKTREIDIRSDLYSFGATLYHIVCGKPPFEGPSAMVVLSKHVEEQIPSPKEAVPSLSDGLCQIIEKLMAKQKEDRYQTPAELLQDLRLVEQGQSPVSATLADGASTVRQRALLRAVEARKEAERQQSRSQETVAATRKKAPVLIVAGVAAVLLIGLVVAWFSLSPKGGSPGSAGVLPAPGAKAPPDKSGTTNKQGPLVVPPSGGSGESPIDPKKTPAEAGTTNEGLAGIAGMFREAEKYAQEHPEDFKEVVGRFETVQKRGEGTEYEFKAKDQAKSWRSKWEEAAKAEFEKRQQAAEAHVQAGRFEEAGKLWNEFPEALATETFRKRVEEEQTKLAETAKSLVDQLSAQAEPLLAKEPETLTEPEVEALTGIRDRAKTPPAGLDEHQKDVLSSLLEKVEACLDAYQSAKAAESAKAFDSFWDKFSKLIKDRRFEEAEALIAANPSLVVPPSGGSGEHPEPPEGGTTNKLKEDVRLLKDLFSRAEANLGQLIGKTIRLAGFGTVKVTAVRDGKIVVAVSGKDMALEPEKLEPEELLKLGLTSTDDPKVAAHQEFLFHFFFGQPAKAKTALAKAKAHGVELAFYEGRLIWLDQGQEKARAEKEAAALVSQIESAIKAEKVETAESKLQRLEKEFGQTQAAKANVAKLREQIMEAQSKAAAKKNLVFIPAGKFLCHKGQEIDLPAFYIGKYEVSNVEYDEFEAWVKKEAEKGEKGDPHRFCYPGYLPDGKELPEEQLKALEKMTPEKRRDAIEKLGLKGGEPGTKGHQNTQGGGDFDKPNHPVVNVDWYDAWAYCRWRGGRLPTDQEWWKAASWDPKLKRERVYPWGDEFMAKYCNSSSPEDGFAQTCPVNEFPKGISAYGCHNMAGNVWEWCGSWYDYDKVGWYRVNRGGSWYDGAGKCRSAYRNGSSPGGRSGYHGCRVARSSP